MYKILKEDCGHYKAYLHTYHLGLVSQRFLCNPESHLSESFEVVHSDFMELTTQFYCSMLDANGNLQGAKMVWNNHRFLIKKHSVILKRYIFFKTNLGKCHWVMTCLCNPWVYVLREWQKN